MILRESHPGTNWGLVHLVIYSAVYIKKHLLFAKQKENRQMFSKGTGCNPKTMEPNLASARTGTWAGPVAWYWHEHWDETHRQHLSWSLTKPEAVCPRHTRCHLQTVWVFSMSQRVLSLPTEGSQESSHLVTYRRLSRHRSRYFTSSYNSWRKLFCSQFSF